jgi:prepilin-type N-terminal cleavage/methylation domain-containing protein
MTDMRHSRFSLSGHRGDTIVEVMIAVVIIGAVLAAAFVLTNRNSEGVRDTEEHSQAMLLLKGQLEQLRSIAPSTTYGDLPDNFCFDNDSSATDPMPSLASGAFGCKAANSLYGFSISKDAMAPPVSGTPDTTLFTLKAQWDGILGVTANEQLVYKVTLAQ